MAIFNYRRYADCCCHVVSNEDKVMYDISEKGEKQFKRVERLIWGLYILIPVLLLTTGCGNASVIDTDIEPVPTDYLDSPVEKCTHVERYEFDTPGIDAHEVITKKDCEEVIS